jgi:predicted O-methyltransferase YrrM
LTNIATAQPEPKGTPSKFSFEDFLAMQTLAPMVSGFLPWTRFSLRPVALVSVLVEAMVHERCRILEMGSGVSTLLLAAALREQGKGRVIAVEHHPAWAGMMRRLVVAKGLARHASVLVAELAPTSLSLDGSPWYSADVLGPLLDQKHDLLLVDGPPAGEGRSMSRGPALPFFESALTDDALVVLDDIDRPGELAVLQSWEASGTWRFERFPELGIAMASANRAFMHW